jgi:outer membrane protein OmpA-like peptidoglycan-associated protein
MWNAISSRHRRRGRLRRILTIVGLASIFAAFAVGRASAQQTRIPDEVLVQVLGRVPPPTPSTSPPPASEVQLVARRMQQSFEDQLVAGVRRPDVELEVRFEWDSAEIRAASAREIEAAAVVLNEHFPSTRFRLAGYTDPTGSPAYNQRLSERRADAVRAILVGRHGVPAERLEAVGYGEDDPTEPASDAERRRVELQLLRDASSARGSAESAGP